MGIDGTGRLSIRRREPLVHAHGRALVGSGRQSLTYATPPSSFEQVGQKTRRVATVLSDGLATCLDTTLLFARDWKRWA